VFDYRLGVHEVADGCHAYLQPDGGWGYSNAGLVIGDGRSLLVDTLFDLKLTDAMLAAMSPLTRTAQVATVVNTHANGDHCYGNERVANAEIIASKSAAEEMAHVPPAMLAALNKAPGEVGELFRSFFGDFDFDGITFTPPTRTFEGRLDIDVAGRVVELIEVGPAHTNGDVIVHVPDARVVYSGDILFINGTPIVWAGPLENWISACDLIAALGAEVVVPGHGPITDTAGVAQVRDYLSYILREASTRQDAGMDAFDAARDIALGAFGEWGEFGRVCVNVDTVYRSRDARHRSPDVVEQFRRMAAMAAAR
jgi:glyoxylase-like metal-dependent hydrolase (beta-lactamase superfamily II)